MEGLSLDQIVSQIMEWCILWTALFIVRLGSSCGRYIEGSPQLSELEDALDRVGLLDPLFGSF